MNRKSLFKRKERGFPGHSNPPQPPQQPQLTEAEMAFVHYIPFTIPEIDLLMQTLIEANVPIQTYMLLDSKFQSVKVEESRTFSSKINEEAEIVPDWKPGVAYNPGDKYRKPNGHIYQNLDGEEIDITNIDDLNLAANGPGETN